MPNKAVIYARVSTDEQHSENQTPTLRELAHRRDAEIVAEYTEDETAWKAGHQRELARLIGEAQRGRFQIIYVWALDRLSREGPLPVLTLIHRLRVYGVQVISYQESWTEAPGELGDILFALTAWVAQMESKRRSERTKAGLARLRARGIKLGRPTGSGDKKKRKTKVRLFSSVKQ